MVKTKYWVIGLFIVTCILSLAKPILSFPNPDHYWSMDENNRSGNTYYDYFGKTAMVFQVAAEYGKTCMANECVGLDGSTEYAYPEHEIVLNQEHTICLWMFANTSGASPSWFSDTDGATYSDHVHVINAADGKLGAYYRDDIAQFEDEYSTSTVRILGWEHWCVVRYVDGDKVTFYRNGTLDNNASYTINDALNNGGADVAMGRYGSGNMQYFNGFIDEFAIWNDTLSPADISDIWQKGVDGLGLMEAGGGATCTNMTLNATSLYNQTDISVFNATINGTYYNTTTGQIDSGICYNDMVNITMDVLGFEAVTYYNINGTTNVVANLTQLSYGQADLNISYTNYYVGETVTFDCNYTPPEGHNITVNYHWFFDTNISYLSNTTNTSIILQNIWLFDEVNYSCMMCTPYACENTSWVTSDDILDMEFTFNVYDMNLDQPSVNILFTNSSHNYTSNPASVLASDEITTKGQYLTLNVTDLTSLNRDNSSIHYVNENQSEYNITLVPNALTLVFYRYNTSFNVSGIYWDYGNHSDNFTNSTVVIIQQDLAVGNVWVRFNQLGNGNYSQFYEYYNDLQTYIYEDPLCILNASDWYTYIDVVSYSGERLSGVAIEAIQSRPTENEGLNPFCLIGRRMTEGRETFFYHDASSPICFEATHEDYVTATFCTIGGEEFYDSDTPLTLYMRPTLDAFDDYTAYITGLPVMFYNRSNDISGVVTMTGYTTVEITTDYRNTTLTSPWRELTGYCDDVGEALNCEFTLDSGGDFRATGNENVTVYFRFDSGYIQSYLMIYNPNIEQRFQFVNLGLEDNVIIPLLFIVLIMISTGTAFLFPKESVGSTVFSIGCVLLAALHSAFLTLSFMILIGWGMSALRRFVIE